MAQIQNIAVDVMMEVEFIKPDYPAVQMKRDLIFGKLNFFAVQCELAVSYTICYATDKSTEVWVVALTISGDIIETHSNVSNISISIRYINSLDDGTVGENRNRHSTGILPCEFLDSLSLLRDGIFHRSKAIDFNLTVAGRTHCDACVDCTLTERKFVIFMLFIYVETSDNE